MRYATLATSSSTLRRDSDVLQKTRPEKWQIFHLKLYATNVRPTNAARDNDATRRDATRRDATRRDVASCISRSQITLERGKLRT